MKDESFNIVIHEELENKKLLLPINKEQLGSFISELLGQPQSIERELYGTFSIDHSWLIHIHSLIDQRINQQSHESLVEFNAVVFYNNNLKRTIPSIAGFEHFSETKKIRSQAIRMTWTYLVKFPKNDIPEKQEITFYANEKAPIASKIEDPIRRLIHPKHEVGVISYRINHTERTWGG